MKVRQSAEVAAALTSGKPVVALESTITSKMGLPAPYNRECFDRVNAAIRATGAVPAVTAVIDGELWAGIDSTGAGDAFAGGLLVARARGKSWEDALAAGHDAAAGHLQRQAAQSEEREAK